MKLWDGNLPPEASLPHEHAMVLDSREVCGICNYIRLRHLFNHKLSSYILMVGYGYFAATWIEKPKYHFSVALM